MCDKMSVVSIGGSVIDLKTENKVLATIRVVIAGLLIGGRDLEGYHEYTLENMFFLKEGIKLPEPQKLEISPTIMESEIVDRRIMMCRNGNMIIKGNLKHSGDVVVKYAYKPFQRTNLINEAVSGLFRVPKHPSLLDYKGVTDGSGLVSEFVDDSTTLDEWVRNNRGPNLHDKMEGVKSKCLEALEILHSRNLFHGDIKPENIMVGKNGSSIKLIDFSCMYSVDYPLDLGRYGTKGYTKDTNKIPNAEADLYALDHCFL